MNKQITDLAQYLTAEEFTAQAMPASAQAPADQLIVQLEPERLNWKLHAELAFTSDLERAKNTGGAQPEEEDDNRDYLQFFVLLPLRFSPERAGDMSRLVAMINNTLPLIGFSISENQGWVFFRHMMLILDSKVDPAAVCENLTMIEYLIETFGRALDELSSGNKTLIQIVKDDIQWA